MRRTFIAVALLIIPVAAMSQQPQAQPPNVQALQQTVIKLTGESLDWQTQAITLQAQVADLQKQIADAKAKQEPK